MLAVLQDQGAQPAPRAHALYATARHRSFVEGPAAVCESCESLRTRQRTYAPSADPAAAAMPASASQDSAQTADPAAAPAAKPSAVVPDAADDDFVPPSDDELLPLPDIGDVSMPIASREMKAAGAAGPVDEAASDAPLAPAVKGPQTTKDAPTSPAGSGKADCAGDTDEKELHSPPAEAKTVKKKPVPKKSLLKTKKPAAKATKLGKSKVATKVSAGEENSENEGSDDDDDEILVGKKKPATAASKKKTPPPKKKPAKVIKKTPPSKSKLGPAKRPKKAAAAKVIVNDDSSDEESDVEAGAVSPALKDSTNRANANTASKRKSVPKKFVKKSSVKKAATASAVKKRKASGDTENDESPAKKTKSGSMKQRLQVTKVGPVTKGNAAKGKVAPKGKVAATKPAKAGKPAKAKVAKKTPAKKNKKSKASITDDVSDDEGSDVVVDDGEDDNDVPSDVEDEDEENTSPPSAKSKAIGGIGIACSSSDEVSSGLIEAACTQLHGYVIREADQADIFVRSSDSKRTGSLLLAIARGIPVVDVQWLSSSIENGKFLKDLSTFESHVGAKAARISRESTNSAGFMKRARVKIVGQPMSDAVMLRQIVQHCGGKIVQDREHFTVVGSMSDSGSGVENPVSMKYLADSIEQQKLLPEADYRPASVST